MKKARKAKAATVAQETASPKGKRGELYVGTPMTRDMYQRLKHRAWSHGRSMGRELALIAHTALAEQEA